MRGRPVFIGGDGVPRTGGPNGPKVDFGDGGGSKPKPEAEKPKPAEKSKADKDREEARTRADDGLYDSDVELRTNRRLGNPPKITSDDALDAIEQYTRGGGDSIYGKVNESLRSGKEPKDTPPKPQIEHLQELASQTLKKPVIVYRGISREIADELIKVGESNKAAILKGFGSTSLKPDVALGFTANKNPVVLEIKAKRGLYVRDKSEFSEEYELIQSHRTKYRVLGIQRGVKVGQSRKVDVVMMEEL